MFQMYFSIRLSRLDHTSLQWRLPSFHLSDLTLTASSQHFAALCAHQGLQCRRALAPAVRLWSPVIVPVYRIQFSFIFFPRSSAVVLPRRGTADAENKSHPPNPSLRINRYQRFPFLSRSRSEHSHCVLRLLPRSPTFQLPGFA